MNISVFQSHSLTRQEKYIGAGWLLFETLFFAALLQILNSLLPTPLPQPEVNFVFFASNFTAVALIFRRYLAAQLRLFPDVIRKVICTAVLGFAVYLLLNFLLAQVLFALDPDFTSVNDVTVQKLAAEDYYLMLFGTVILVPITEECLFRGLVFRGLYDRSGILAWVISTLLFSAVHITGYIGAYPFETVLLCFVQYIPAGVCLAGAYRLSGSLLSPILIHALVNFVGMLSLHNF